MAEITVVNNTKQIKHLPYRGVTLYPGKNTVDSENIQDNLSHPIVRQDIDNTLIEIKDDGATLDAPDSVSHDNNDVNTPDEDKGGENKADEIENPSDYNVGPFYDEFVENEDNKEKLENYIELEKEDKDRVTLKNKIEDRIEELS